MRFNVFSNLGSRPPTIMAQDKSITTIFSLLFAIVKLLTIVKPNILGNGQENLKRGLLLCVESLRI
jgi:hypothetical protein